MILIFMVEGAKAVISFCIRSAIPVGRKDKLELSTKIQSQARSDEIESEVHTWIHGGTSREDSVGVQVLTDINVTLHDGVEGGFMDTA